jgi:hypothetical protein
MADGPSSADIIRILIAQTGLTEMTQRYPSWQMFYYLLQIILCIKRLLSIETAANIDNLRIHVIWLPNNEKQCGENMDFVPDHLPVASHMKKWNRPILHETVLLYNNKSY